MAKRTQIVCLHEGKTDSVDAVFINRLMRSLKPAWIRPWGSNVIRLKACGNRTAVINSLPDEIGVAQRVGGDITIMVWADVDDDMPNSDALKNAFWEECKRQDIPRHQFDAVVFALAKDRIENWIEFLNTGKTDESREGSRVNNKQAVEAAKRLAEHCAGGAAIPNIPDSLEWSCRSWRALVQRMRR
jgi:hypothetical protein